MISVIELSRTCGVRKQTIFKVISRLGIETTRARSEDSRGQLIAYLTETDARIVSEAIQVGAKSADEKHEIIESGWFYLIQLEPEVDPGRYKLGFASDLDQRLRKHKTSAPFSKLVAYWPCKSLWEKTAIEAISVGSERIHTEVFRAKSIGSVEERAKAFFALMPDRSGLVD